MWLPQQIGRNRVVFLKRTRIPAMTRSSILLSLTFTLMATPGASFESEKYGPSVDFYRASSKSANIASTVATAPHERLFVFGQPRITKGHPSTIWDVEDVDHYREMLRSNRELQLFFADLKARMDDRLEKPIDIPQPRENSEGDWMFPGDYFPDFPGFPGEDSLTKFRRYFFRDAEAISDLGILYALGGDVRYAEYAKALLLGYANAPRYGAPKTLYYRSNQGMTGQLLDEALLLDKLAFGYDLIYNTPSWTNEQRSRVHDELLQPLASEMLYPSAPEIDPTGSFSRQANNRGAIGATSVLLAGYATDDPELVNAALYGIRTSLKKPNAVGLRQFPPPKDWIAANAADPSNGLLTVHFASPCISDGMWVEGSPSYAFYVLGSMIDAAEAAWHHGLDLYRYNNGIFKYMFDFPLLFAYPDMTTPGENDASRSSMLKGFVPTMYEYAYRRYKDPNYLAVINNPEEKHYLNTIANSPSKPPKIGYDRRHLGLSHVGSVPPSLLFDLDPNTETPVRKTPNVNYPGVGFGILRTRSSDQHDVQNLILSYGPSASHHPDKLHIDLYAFDDVLMPSPGVQYPYAGNLLIDKWYHTTLSHNTVTVDEKSQAVHPHSDKLADVHADQITYAPAETFGMQRAWTDSAYPGIIMDRAVFLSREYLADLFGVFSETEHKYDLAWHIRGAAVADLAFEPKAFPNSAPGYNALVDVLHAEPTDKAWSVSLSHEGHTARLLQAAGAATQAFIGKGGVYVDFSSGARDARPTATTIIERRENMRTTIFGNALDVSDSKNGFVKSVIEYTGVDYSYALLKITTQIGTDFCFSSYASGEHDIQDLHTDAIQAFVRMNGVNPQALYLGGGTELAIKGAFIRRDQPGLAYLERDASGEYTLANPSPTPANITLLFPALSGFDAYVIDRWDRREGAANITKHPNNVISVHLDAETKIKFAR